MDVTNLIPLNENSTSMTSTTNDIEQIEDFVRGPANPLHDVVPPVHTENVENLVLIQAKAIKDTLQRIFDKDPTARCHFFPFLIFDENKQILEKNGYIVKITGEESEVFTEISWTNATKLIISVPH